MRCPIVKPATPNGIFDVFFSPQCIFLFAMPLPEPKVQRSLAHTRRIEVQGFLREDGHFELDARLSDLKDMDYPLSSGLRSAEIPFTICSCE